MNNLPAAPSASPSFPLPADLGNGAVRAIMIDGKPWFIVRDICIAIGLDLAKGTTPHLRRIPNRHKRLVLRSEIPNLILDGGSAFPNRGLVAVSEAGLYRLIMRSDKEAALDFQDWIAETVLPSIRQHGGYILGQEHLAEEKLAEVTGAIRVIAGIVREEEIEARDSAFRLLSKGRRRRPSRWT
ncbi:BRO-N domain-containing protein [Amaricoccus solimangrovi]|uniref:Bro-N domain-containing protein n=1 Tax=Amaricoccus solimangrovi TaxID=2589815 RepID=A0A501WGR5_9RHOB|nr:BRO family protein [Amaricoccus solimangrovi]TPE47550.1 hypothetical protein FJM51_19645 [Amaricoccus solimangrovi]